ncbi:MAG: alpha-L-rhamnosidase [Clostridia bacterium]|nr:alpha-L-rhamnosidase [Clostridia bacterium]
MKTNEFFSKLSKTESDCRVRKYVLPQRVVHCEGSVCGAENMLDTAGKKSPVFEDERVQVHMNGSDCCALENKDGVKSSVIFDFGIEMHGSMRLIVKSVSPNRVNVRIRFGESVMETMSDVGEGLTAKNDHANRDFVWNVGFLSANETNESGFRFVKIDLLDDNAKIEIQSVTGVMIYRDIEFKGSFECDDELVNDIWRTSVHTTHMCMQEYLWDGIKRDRLVWIGDMQIECLTIASVFGYNEVVPKSLDLIRDITPVGTWMNGMSSYSLWWILIHYDWYMKFGSLEYLSEQSDYLLALIDVVASLVKENGSENMPDCRFIDWPNQANPEATHAGLQGMMVMALEAGAVLASALSAVETVEKCNEALAKLKSYVPSPAGSKQAASLLAYSGVADAKKMDDEIISVGGVKGYSTFLGYHTLATKALAGNYKGALDAMKEYWGAMLDLGATTFWEDFNIDWAENAARIDEITPEGKVDVHGSYGGYCYVGYRHSFCHGWASGPVPYITRFVLGIEILEPACRKIRIRPNMSGLKHIKASYPTPFGNINIQLDEAPDGTINKIVDAPAEIEIVD